MGIRHGNIFSHLRPPPSHLRCSKLLLQNYFAKVLALFFRTATFDVLDRQQPAGGVRLRLPDLRHAAAAQRVGGPFHKSSKFSQNIQRQCSSAKNSPGLNPRIRWTAPEGFLRLESRFRPEERLKESLQDRDGILSSGSRGTDKAESG